MIEVKRTSRKEDLKDGGNTFEGLPVDRKVLLDFDLSVRDGRNRRGEWERQKPNL